MMNGMHKKILTLLFFASTVGGAQAQSYPRGYFRSPLNIPMQLVANFGEIRANHWHMGLDIRTQQRENLPVYAAADGYVARIKVEPGGFGQAIYINHPNGFTTLYAHLNQFFPALQQAIKEEQYGQETWAIELQFPPDRFPVHKGELIALSGNTGGSAGPHVHFEIRDTKTEKVLNPLLFGFPLSDAVPPTVTRVAMYDRNKSTYQQSPQIFSLGGIRGRSIKVGSDKISFAISATDRIGGSNNGIYAAKISVDGKPVSSFALNNIGYDETRYINAQIDYPFAARGGGHLQHISPLPGATEVAYDLPGGDGIIHLSDSEPHAVLIEVQDANFNTTGIPFTVQYDGALLPASSKATAEQFLPRNINVFEQENFQVVTTENSMYDAVNVSYSQDSGGAANAVSPLHHFLSAAIPAHDSVMVRIKPSVDMPNAWMDRIVIKNVSGSKTFVQKAVWQKGWLMARFRQFGTYQAFVDNVPPNVNGVAADLSRASRIVFTPTDNFNTIRRFRAELDGQWLRFTNDKGRTWIYTFDEHFPRGEHQLKVTVEDEAGNVTERTWNVKR
ncbi:peptidoglycan DD-metalloendopeptidase family protein [Flavisolibacter nicotianae]|uniref:peptidoglycan DD-metalloendopeptidase family protein n=1 Tax=Flavisolibacter nicotianae TaxID=2364882 RepID=UPI000EAB5401|nr:peptidoglycan DD-metalloendopeptidase family protein [Flavisolibacter nicotianae]